MRAILAFPHRTIPQPANAAAAESSSRGEDRQGEEGREGEEVAAMMVRQSKAALKVEDRSLRLR